ncbi:MAG: hypothetical protein Q9174_002172, partial [Haloplaca sp. 1 TL-2023]
MLSFSYLPTYCRKENGINAGISPDPLQYDDLPPALLLTPIPTYKSLTYTDFTYASQINNSI